MRDLMSKIHPMVAIPPQSVSDNTPMVSNIIDRQGFDSLAFIIAIGTLADAAATFTVLVEHSDLSDFSVSEAVPDKFLIGTEIMAGFQFDDDNETRKIGYTGGKQYTRITVTPVGNAAAANVAAVAVLGHPAVAPTDNPPV